MGVNGNVEVFLVFILDGRWKNLVNLMPDDIPDRMITPAVD